MSQYNRSLVGSVVERKTGASSSPSAAKFSAIPSKTGFPAVQHRSKSAFAKGRDELRKSGPSRSGHVPIVLPSSQPKQPPDLDDWRNQISEENERKVEEMSEEEREKERREIIERFGPGVGDILKRVRENRHRQMEKGVAMEVPGKANQTMEESSFSYKGDLPESAHTCCYVEKFIDRQASSSKD